MAETKAQPLKRRIGAAFHHALSRAIVLLVIALLNPFGIVEWTELRGRDIWLRLYAPLYAGAGMHAAGGHKATGRNAITVVRVDRTSLDALSGTVTDGHDSRDLLGVVQTVARAPRVAPRAIFVDLLLGDLAPENEDSGSLLRDAEIEAPKCGDAKVASPFRCLLAGIGATTRYFGPPGKSWRDDAACQNSAAAKILCIRRVGGVPVIVADPIDLGDPAAVRSEGMKALSMVAARSPTRIDPAAYQLTNLAADARVNRPYELYPAAALYGAYCAMPAKPAGCAPIIAPGGQPDLLHSDELWPADYTGWSTKFDQPVETVWGTGSPSAFTRDLDRLQGGTLSQRCTPADTGGWSVLRSILLASAAGININVGTPCLYTNSITLEGLGMLDQAGRDRALGDKIVLIGLDDPVAPDLILVPQFGKIPGVFAHAMALDNLIENGANYSKPPIQIVGLFDVTDADLRNIFAALILMLITGLAIATLKERNEALLLTMRPAWSEWGKRLYIIVVAMLAIVSSWAVLLLMFGIYPLSYNFATLTIVAVIEILNITGVALRPIRDLLARRFAMIGFFVEPEPSSPPSPLNRPSRRKGRGKTR